MDVVIDVDLDEDPDEVLERMRRRNGEASFLRYPVLEGERDVLCVTSWKEEDSW